MNSSVETAFLGKAETLKRLLQNPDFLVYEGLIKDFRQAALESMAEASPDEFKHWQGAAKSLLWLLNRPQEIIEHAEQVIRNEQDAGKHRDMRLSPAGDLDDSSI